MKGIRNPWVAAVVIGTSAIAIAAGFHALGPAPAPSRSPDLSSSDLTESTPIGISPTAPASPNPGEIEVSADHSGTYYSSVEQNGGTAEGGDLFPDEFAQPNCQQTTTGWLAQQQRDEAWQIVTSNAAGEVQFNFKSSTMSAIVGGTDGGPLEFSLPLDTCRTMYANLTRTDPDLIKLVVVSPTGETYSRDNQEAYARYLGGEVREGIHFVPDAAGDWTFQFWPIASLPEGGLELFGQFSQPEPVNRDPYAVCEAWVSGNTITVDGSKSWDDDGTVAEVQWDFGNGPMLSGLSLTQTIADYTGAVYIACVVSDNFGGKTFSGISVAVPGG